MVLTLLFITFFKSSCFLWSIMKFVPFQISYEQLSRVFSRQEADTKFFTYL